MKSVATKLLIKPGTTLWSTHPERLELIEPLADDVRIVDRQGDATTVLVFGDDDSSLREALGGYMTQPADPETIWVAYPKGNRTDINRDSVWPILAEHGLRPIAQVSLDDVWSALRFRPLRPGEPPFEGAASRGR